VLQSAGITPVGTVSPSTAACIVHEGYFAAQIQLGYEMANTKSMAFSADGTGHCGINFNSTQNMSTCLLRIIHYLLLLVQQKNKLLAFLESNHLRWVK
jgi:hypothetical protein